MFGKLTARNVCGRLFGRARGWKKDERFFHENYLKIFRAISI